MCQCKIESGGIYKPCGHGCTALTNPVPHKHSALIKAWADGAKIQVQSMGDTWLDCFINPSWDVNYQYRIKPKPDVVIYSELQARTELGLAIGLNRIKDMPSNNVIITFDGETGKLKSVEIIK